MRYRKTSPHIVEAIQLRWDTWCDLCESFSGGNFVGCYVDQNGMPINDINGRIGIQITMGSEVSIGVENDWIIRDERGTLYPCNPLLFEETYEPFVEEPSKLEMPSFWHRIRE